MIKHDYKPQSYNTRQSWRRPKIPAWLTHPYLILSMAALVLMLALILSADKNKDEGEQLQITPVELQLGEQTSRVIDQPESSAPISEEAQWSQPIELPLAINEPSSNDEASLLTASWQQIAVKKGDNLSLIFKRIGLNAQWVHRVITLDRNTQVLKKLRPGELIYYRITGDKLDALKYSISLQRTLYVLNEDGKLRSRVETKTIEKRLAFAAGTIEDSLFAAGKKAGLSDSQVMELANIFDWDVDFILDIRKGDSFAMLYEEEFLDGEKIGDGPILAAEFINQGKTYRAIRYTDSKGRTSYFTPSGLSMRKAFLRAPLKFSYISSNFKPRRFHPILKRWKAHRGIDYRAPTGTPVRAAGDGKVIASSYNKYNGKYVFIQHGQGIVTKYLHLSRRAVSRGKRVKQGQVIGYVGATGLAEAPHLHYEFVVNGVHRNPRTVKLPDAEPIAPSEKAEFTAVARPLLEQLEQRKRLMQTINIAP